MSRRTSTSATAANGSKLLLASILNAGNSTTGGGTSVIADISGDDATIGIRYLQQRGVIRLLSEPTLVTLSGKPATFVAGGEFAVPTVVGSVGLNAVTTDFRAFGAIISFLPTVLDKDRVRLQVAPEFSQINNQLAVNGTPGLNVRSATTTVEMREGQTLAIAGLLEDSYKATNVGEPAVPRADIRPPRCFADRDRADHPGDAGARASDGTRRSAAAPRLRRDRTDERRVLPARTARRTSQPRVPQHRLAPPAEALRRPGDDERPVWARKLDTVEGSTSQRRRSNVDFRL
jgi:hypothetical protein